MKLYQVNFKQEWKVLRGTRRSQAAIMTIKPGDSEGGPNNKHSGDQWLYISSGTGTALFGRKRIALKAGSLLLIKAGEKHEIKNTGRQKLSTLNFYAPPQKWD